MDLRRVVISGGSAGGYTTLAALAFRDFFQGGASYYGVSDAAALARDTHKFESRYLDWLIGPYPEEEPLYRERSPVYHADRLSKPVIFFQGSEDDVVPPNQSGRHSSLHSAGPRGGRHGSARPNPGGARRYLSLLKQPDAGATSCLVQRGVFAGSGIRPPRRRTVAEAHRAWGGRS